MKKLLLLLSFFLSAAVTAWAEKTAKAVYVESDAGATLTFYYDDVTHEGEVRNLDDLIDSGWFYWYGWQKCDRGMITSVVVDPSFADYRLTTAANMFGGFEACQSITGLQYFNTEDVTDMTSMFSECFSLTSLDLSSFDTHNVTTMDNMFSGCSALVTIYASDDFVTPAFSYSERRDDFEGITRVDYYTNTDGMFSGCVNLIGGKGTKNVDSDSYGDEKLYARIDGGTIAPGYFTAIAEVSPHYALAILSGNTLSFQYKTLEEYQGIINEDSKIYQMSYIFGDGWVGQWPWTGEEYWDDGGDEWGDEEWAKKRGSSKRSHPSPQMRSSKKMASRAANNSAAEISRIVIDPSFNDYALPTADGFFSNLRSCESITGLENLNISKATYMSYMFYGCSSLTTLDLSSFDTQNVTNMNGMFYECEALTTIYASEQFVAPESYDMFSECYNLVGGMGTRYGDYNYEDYLLAHIDGGQFSPGYFSASNGVVPIYAAAILEGTTLTLYYKTISELESLAGNGAQIFSVETRSWYKEEWIWDDETGEEYYELIHPLITQVNIDPSFSDYKPRSLSYLFAHLGDCERIDGLENLNLTSVYDMSYMFYECSKLTTLDLSSFYTPKLERVDYMFGECSSLTTIYASEKFIAPDDYTTYNDSYTDVLGAYMFSGCENIVGGAGTTYNSKVYDPGIYFGTRLERERYRKGFDCSYACIDEGAANPGYFTGKEFSGFDPSGTSNTYEMVVNLPQTNLRSLNLEVINTANGQRQRYLLKDGCSVYTFYGLKPNTKYDVFVKTSTGEILASETGVEINEENVSVTFASLIPTYTLSLSVTTPDGTDVTNQVSITWTTESGAYLVQGSVLYGVIENKLVHYEITLPQRMDPIYVLPTPGTVVVGESTHEIEVELKELTKRVCKGKVIYKKTANPVYGATLSIAQTLNGRYNYSATATTDAEGFFSVEVFDDQPTEATLSLAGYQRIHLTQEQLFSETPLAVEMIPLDGTVITTHLYLTESVLPGVVPQTNDYIEYEHVAYSIENIITNSTILEFDKADNYLIFHNLLANGDVIRVTVKSLDGSFADMAQQYTIDDQDLNITFNLTALGGIVANYHTSDCESVVGLLFDKNGNRVSREYYQDATLSMSNLPQGSYTLVTIEGNKKYSDLLSLSQLHEFGLAEGYDYLCNAVQVLDGQISTLEYDNIAHINEQSLILSDYSSFRTNQPSITAGNYITLVGTVGFLPEKDELVSNVNLIIELPTSMKFVENSVLLGTDLVSYSVQGNQVHIPLSADNYKGGSTIRLCAIPQEAGLQTAIAYVKCKVDEEYRTEVIGTANVEVKTIGFFVPSTIATPQVAVQGNAPAESSILVYDSNTLIGMAKAKANGTWSATCDLQEPYQGTYHKIHADVQTPAGLALHTDMQQTYFDPNEIHPTTCSMKFFNESSRQEVRVTWDFRTGTTDKRSYSFYTTTKFYFNLKFNTTDISRLQNVKLHIRLSNGETLTCDMLPDYLYGTFSLAHTFSSDQLPVNLEVTYDLDSPSIIDDTEAIAAQDQYLGILNSEMKTGLADVEFQLTPIVEEENRFVASAHSKNSTDSVTVELIPLDYTAVASSMSENSYYPFMIDSVLCMINAENEPNGINYTIVNQEEGVAFQMKITNYDLTTSDEASPRRAKIPRNALKSAINAMRKKFNDWKPGIKHFFLVDQPFYDGSTSTAIWDLLGVEKDLVMKDQAYGDLVHADQIIDQFERQMEELDKRHNDIQSLITRKCSDGTYAFSKSDREKFFARLEQISNSETDYLNKFFDNLEEYKNALMWSTIFDCSMTAATMGLGSAKIASFASKWKPIGKLLDKFDKWSPICKDNTKGAALFGIGVLLDKIPGTQYMDYEAERQELLAHLRDTYVALLRDYTQLRKQITTTTTLCPHAPFIVVIVYRFEPVTPILDPSGYVYEAVASNRVEGATATAYYREAELDANGDSILVAKKWDAEEYAQKNPLFTDVNGMYQWDVPQGEWQVKFEKEGYETTYSEWLPVPPPQLEVNIPMTQYSAPEIAAVEAYESGIIITFDKYMIPSTLSLDNISLLQNGKAISGKITLIDEEEDASGSKTTYAKQLRIQYDKSLDYGSTIVLTINRKVKSYAGVPMTDDFSQEFTVEREVTSIEATAALTMVPGEKQEVEIMAMPTKAAKGKTVSLSMSSWEYVSVDEEALTLDNNGTAKFMFTAESLGQLLVTYHLEGTNQTAETMITVLPDMSTGIKDIVSNDWSSDKGYLLVLDINGKMISRIDNAESLSDFDMTALNDGIYILSFVGENHTTSKKVMKKGN